MPDHHAPPGFEQDNEQPLSECFVLQEDTITTCQASVFFIAQELTRSFESPRTHLQRKASGFWATWQGTEVARCPHGSSKVSSRTMQGPQSSPQAFGQGWSRGHSDAGRMRMQGFQHCVAVCPRSSGWHLGQQKRQAWAESFLPSRQMDPSAHAAHVSYACDKITGQVHLWCTQDVSWDEVQYCSIPSWAGVAAGEAEPTALGAASIPSLGLQLPSVLDFSHFLRVLLAPQTQSGAHSAAGLQVPHDLGPHGGPSAGRQGLRIACKKDRDCSSGAEEDRACSFKHLSGNESHF